MKNTGSVQRSFVNVSGSYKEVTAGFGSSVWAINDNGDVYKKNGVTSMQPFGKDWEQIYGEPMSRMHAGMGGVFGLTSGGYLVKHKGMDKAF